MKNRGFLERLEEGALTLSENLTPKHIQAIEFLFERAVNNISFVNKEEFAEEIIKGQGLNNLKYAKKLLEELIVEANFLSYSNENKRRTLTRKGNLFLDFIWTGSSTHFKVTWNGELFLKKAISSEPTISYRTRTYYSLLKFFRECMEEGNNSITISFPKLAEKISPKEGAYFYKGAFQTNSFLKKFLLPNLDKLKQVEGIDVSWERVVILEAGSKPNHGLKFTLKSNLKADSELK